MTSNSDAPTTQNHDDSSLLTDTNVSLLTEASNTSTLEWAGGVMSRAGKILRGQLPTPPSSEPDESGVPRVVDSKEWIAEGETSNESTPRNLISEETGNHDDEDMIDFLKDAPREMTWGRRIALKLMTKQWYNPPLKDEQQELAALVAEQKEEGLVENDASNKPVTTKPNLQKAWAYFEHVTLPRYIDERDPSNRERKSLPKRCVRKFCKGNRLTLDRAEPGEKHLPTRLYSPLTTPLSQMGDFGLGIGLYFSSLRAITVLTFMAGIISIPNFIYFAGDDYSDGQEGVGTLTMGSAICTRQVWVPCTDCTSDDFQDSRIGYASGENNETLTFALQNDCDGATLQQGFVNYGTMIFMLIGVIIMNEYQKRMEVAYDEDEQTAQDYSVLVENPPPDANDPEEWRAFFRDTFNAQLTACTVAVDNDLLVRSLVERRECYRKLEITLPPGTPLDSFQHLAGYAANVERNRRPLQALMAMVSPGIPEVVARIAVLSAKVQGLAQLDYPATNVFLTFETEQDQRKILSALSVGSFSVKRNDATALKDPSHLFRGETVLKVKEPDEPSNVRWQDLNVKFKERIKPLITTTLATLAAIALVAFIVSICNDVDAAWAAIAIAVGNGIFPVLAKFLTSFESHTSEGGKQTSLYFKIALFRWTNTAIVITIITPFTSTLENNGGVIEGIAAIFFAEIVTTNAIQLADPMGHIQRHFLAPRAVTQDMANLNMRGTVFELAERYTNATKLLFLSLFYCAIYPGALFMCSFALLVNYFSDRFSLMRSWARTPKLGTRIAKFSRKYFFSTALIAMALVSAYAWSGFPYDNLCSNDDEVDAAYLAVTTILDGNGNARNVTVDPSDTTYRYCLQDLLRTRGRSFPAIPKHQPEGGEWMTEDQEAVTTVYGWTSVGVMALMLSGFVYGFLASVRRIFRSTYSPSGKDMRINFSDVSSVNTYVPQVSSPLFAYPLLACNIDGIDPDLFDWCNPDRPHSYYDISKDTDELLKGIDVPATYVFSKLAHWPPENQPEHRASKRTLLESKLG